MQTVIRSRFGAFACVGAFVYLPRTSTSSMTASNMTIEELKAVVTEELQELNGHLGTVNEFFKHMGKVNAWVTNHAANGESAARVVHLLRRHTEALFELVGNESSSSSEGGAGSSSGSVANCSITVCGILWNIGVGTGSVAN